MGAALLAGALLGAPAAHAAPGKGHSRADVRGHAPLSSQAGKQAKRGQFRRAGKVGEVRMWPVLDMRDEAGDSVFLKEFRLRVISPHAEVWTAVGDDVSTGLDYAAGDCRNGIRTTVTEAQLGSMADSFERVVRPRLTAAFGATARRDGSQAQLPHTVPGVPADAYRAGGNRQVILVDNIRDGEFDAAGPIVSTIGYVSHEQIALTDRNLLTLDGVDWAYQLGTNPRASVDHDDFCQTAERIPQFTEGVLAHEYTHVIQAATGLFDPHSFDNVWVKEGTASYAVRVAGLVDPAEHEGHTAMIDCFTGRLFENAEDPDRACPGGPANGLTDWGELVDFGQAGASDYGAAWSFMEFLDARYGPKLVARFMNATGPSIPRLDALLAERRAPERFEDLVGEWSAAVAIDGVLDDGATLLGARARDVQVPGLNTEIAWDAPWTHQGTLDFPQIGRNASDFVRLRDGSDTYLNAGQLQSLDFDGDEELECKFEVDPNGHGAGDAALKMRSLNLLNGAIARRVTVPADDPTLSFDVKFDTEAGWDFAYVQVSTDGGQTWKSLPTGTSTSEHEPQAYPDITADLPGWTGSSNGWIHESADLSEYAGQEVMIGFRYRTDPLVIGGGFWVDNVAVGDQVISTGDTLEGWSQVGRKTYRMDLRLVSYTDDHRVASVARVPLDAHWDAHLDAADLARLVAPGAQTVAAIVTHVGLDPDAICPVTYALTVNGVSQER